MSYMIGAYVGGLVITFALTRLVRWILRKRVRGVSAALIPAAVVLAVTLALGSLRLGFTEALMVYGPCILLWAVVDLSRS
jgi:predicted PurR-regulated permease PerM